MMIIIKITITIIIIYTRIYKSDRYLHYWAQTDRNACIQTRTESKPASQPANQPERQMETDRDRPTDRHVCVDVKLFMPWPGATGESASSPRS